MSETQNLGKYTEQELRDRGIGKFHAADTRGWATKLSTYHDEGVKPAVGTKGAEALRLGFHLDSGYNLINLIFFCIHIQ